LAEVVISRDKTHQSKTHQSVILAEAAIWSNYKQKTPSIKPQAAKDAINQTTGRSRYQPDHKR